MHPIPGEPVFLWQRDGLARPASEYPYDRPQRQKFAPNVSLAGSSGLHADAEPV